MVDERVRPCSLVGKSEGRGWKFNKGGKVRRLLRRLFETVDANHAPQLSFQVSSLLLSLSLRHNLACFGRLLIIGIGIGIDIDIGRTFAFRCGDGANLVLLVLLLVLLLILIKLNLVG
jgi:hypothetical protein